MKKFIKIVFFIFLAITSVIGFTVLGFGFWAKKSFDEAVGAIAEPLNQEVSFVGDTVEITTYLNGKEGVLLDNFKICKPHKSFDYSFSYNSGCINGKCSTKLTQFKKGEIPESIEIYQALENKECKKVTIGNLRSLVKTLEYESSVTIDDNIKNHLGDRLKDKKVTKTAKSKFAGRGFFSNSGNPQLSFQYLKKIESDEFQFGGVLFKLFYKKPSSN